MYMCHDYNNHREFPLNSYSINTKHSLNYCLKYKLINKLLKKRLVHKRPHTGKTTVTIHNLTHMSLDLCLFKTPMFILITFVHL